MFNKLSIRQRLAVLTVAFLIPVLALLYFLVREQSLAIDFARKEIAGIEYLRVMRPLLADLLAQRDFRMAVRAGDQGRAADLDRSSISVGQRFENAKRVSGTLSMPLVSTRQIESIQQVWRDGARSSATTDATDTAVIEETLRHIVAVGNESNLVLDPDVDSYYCMDAVIFKLPKLLTEISDARGQSFQVLKGLAPTAAGLDARQREALQALGVSLREARVAMHDNIEFGLRSNAEVDRQLGPRFRETETRIERLIGTLTGTMQVTPGADELFTQMGSAIEGTFGTYDASLDVLKELIDIRIAGFQRRRIISFSIVIPSLIVGLWIIFLLQRYMESRNQELSQALNLYNQVIQELEVSVTKYEEQTEELARSNSDLQQFAYVASHDLQEPLRIVSSYAQLFEQRYKSVVDEKGQKWIFYMVDASKRMQRLIEDLLAYSRVGTKAKEPAPVDSRKCAQDALANLRLAIERSGAEVTLDGLPHVMADNQQLTQLFQNLIGNALKYRGEDAPRIHIGGVSDGTRWRFSVRDNGIGIEPRFNDRIFGLFQRLHERGKYEGTGIGLAICKKIVERHGGTIWVDSNQEKGTTFHFTLALAAERDKATERDQATEQSRVKSDTDIGRGETRVKG